MMKCKGLIRIGLSALIMTVSISPLFSQLTRGFVSGVITDPNGGVLVGVQVTVTNKATNVSREAITNDVGFYRFAAVEPGDYAVEFKLSGFQTRKVDPVTVTTAQEATINPVLMVGGVTAEVSVTEVPGADLTKANATIERTFPGSLVEDLPLMTISSGVRDGTRLALLAPNAIRAPGQNGFAVNGQRGRSNNFMIDAVDNNDYAVTLDAARVVPEAVAEIQVQTSAYSAEFGRNSGAQFSAVTKSGANQYHGEGWEFYRGNWMEPVSLINKRAGINTTPRFDFNEFGGDVGGPVIHNRTFFFGLADWSRRREAPDARNATSANVPSPAGYAALQSIPLASGQTQASRQAALSALTFLPQVYPSIVNFNNLQNVAINGASVQFGTILIPLPKPYSFFSNTVRVDHKLSDKDNLMYRYYIDNRDQPNVTDNLQFGTRWAAEQSIRRQNHAIAYTRVLNPRFLNEARVAYVRSNLAFPENDPVSPTVAINSFFTIGGTNAFPQGRFDHTWQFQDVVTSTAGRHSMRFGLDLRKYWLHSQADTNAKGTWTFNTFADFINNQAASLAQALNTTSFVATEWDQAYFFQDDFRAAKNLTLNLGLRYQYYTLPLDMMGATDPTMQAAGIPGPAKPDTTNWAPRIGFAYSPGSKFLGDGKTVIRGGFGVQYDVIFYNVLTNIATNYPRGINSTILSPQTFNLFPTLAPKTTTIPPFSASGSFINSPVDIKHPATDLWSLSVQREFGRDYVLEVGYSGNRSYHQIRQSQANPPVLTADQAATVITAQSANAIPSLQARRLNPNWGGRTLIESTAKGAYEAGYIKFDRRMTRNLMIGADYTFSGTWSDNDELISGITDITNSSPAVPEDFFNYHKEWSRSAFDRPQRLAVTYVYQIPWFSSGWAGQSLSKVMSGWQISGFTDAQSGQPFTIVTGVDSAGVNALGGRPNYNSSGVFMPNYSLTPAGPVKQDYSGGLRTFYIPLDSTGIVVAPRVPNGILANSMPGGGNLGRNTFRGPGFSEWNLSLRKRVKVTETAQLEIRSDFSNLWNHRNFANPVASMSSTTFGQNTASLVGDGVRAILLNAKLRF
jgi:outer membrane receptor protein involved in Fe transport